MPGWRLFAQLILAGMVALTARGAEPPAPKLAGTDVPAPTVRSRVEPVYPEDAQREGISGVVIVEVLIDDHGNVARALLVSSVPALDEAALTAVRQWKFAVTRVDGQPVPVLHVVPVSFTQRLPEVRTQKGMPELRRGLSPKPPQVDSAPPAVAVVAEMTLAADGSVASLQLREGPQPWADAVLGALRTWRFTPPREGIAVTLRLETMFLDGGSNSPRIRLTLTGMQEAATVTAQEERPATPAPADVVALPAPASSPAAPTVEDVPLLTDESSFPVEVVDVAGPAPTPTPPPPPPGVSTIAGVLLTRGVPDLVSGRRPVVPPLARLRSVTGNVTVRFNLDSEGRSAVQDVDGPAALQEQASQAVRSWTFRRLSPERIFLTAVFRYTADDATAEVALRK